jgi:trans-2-enoyl-CoA reductase
MASQTEKTGFVTLENIKDVQFDEHTRMLVIENDKYIVTTINCQKEMADLEAVIRGDNWVNLYSLAELISNETLLSDFKLVRDGRDERDLEFGDLGFVEDIAMSDLLF